MKIEIRQVMILSIFLNTDEKQELVSTSSTSATFPSPPPTPVEADCIFVPILFLSVY